MGFIIFYYLPWQEYWGLQQQPQTNTSWLLFEQQLHFHQVHAESSKRTKRKFQLLQEGSKQGLIKAKMQKNNMYTV